MDKEPERAIAQRVAELDITSEETEHAKFGKKNIDDLFHT